jgi:hypothetical protein
LEHKQLYDKVYLGKMIDIQNDKDQGGSRGGGKTGETTSLDVYTTEVQ